MFLQIVFVVLLEILVKQAVYWCDISTTGTRLVSCSHDKLICIWDLRSGTLSRTLVGHAGPVLQVWFDPKDHNRFVDIETVDKKEKYKQAREDIYKK